MKRRIGKSGIKLFFKGKITGILNKELYIVVILFSFFIISGEASIPVTIAPAWCIISASCPVPQPTSRIFSHLPADLTIQLHFHRTCKQSCVAGYTIQYSILLQA